jgi:O-antigen/teichoic acid export membrane protein
LAILNGGFAFLVLFRQEPKLRPSFPLAKGSLRYGLVIYTGSVANLIHFKIDQVMLNYMLGSEAVGIYTVSVHWAEMLFILDSAIISAALYKISSSPAKESYLLTKRLFKAQVLVSGISGLLLCAFAYPLLFHFYGEAYMGAIWPLIFLVPGVVAWSCGKILSQYLSYNRGKFWAPTLFAIVGVFINVILNLLLISRFGINGAAIASTISYGSVILLTIGAYTTQAA